MLYVGLVPDTEIFVPLPIVIDDAGLELVIERDVPVPFAIVIPVPADKFVAMVGTVEVPPRVIPELTPPELPSFTELTPVFEIVTAPVPLETPIPVPATLEVTPVFVITGSDEVPVLPIPVPVPTEITPLLEIVTAPVPLETPIPVPATLEVTPVFSIVEGVEPVFKVKARPLPVVVKLDTIVDIFGFSEVVTSIPFPADTPLIKLDELTFIFT